MQIFMPHIYSDFRFIHAVLACEKNHLSKLWWIVIYHNFTIITQDSEFVLKHTSHTSRCYYVVCIRFPVNVSLNISLNQILWLRMYALKWKEELELISLFWDFWRMNGRIYRLGFEKAFHVAVYLKLARFPPEVRTEWYKINVLICWDLF